MQYKKLNNRAAFNFYLKEPTKLLFSYRPDDPYDPNNVPYHRDINQVLAVDFAEQSGWVFYIEHEPFTAKVTLDGDSDLFESLVALCPRGTEYHRHMMYEVTIKESEEEG